MIFNSTIEGRDFEIKVSNEPSGNYILFQDNGVDKEYILKGFKTNFQAKHIICDYCLLSKDSQGNILGSKSLTYPVDSLEYNFFYGFKSKESFGVMVSKNLLNGILYFNYGVHVFDNEGNFVDPFDPKAV